MSEYTEKKEEFHTIEPSGAINTKIVTKVFQNGNLIATKNHRGVTDSETPENDAKLLKIVGEIPTNQNKTIVAFKTDIADLKHEKDSLCEELVVKDQLIEKMTASLASKDAKISVLEDELKNLTK